MTCAPDALPVTIDDVRAARARLAGQVIDTPFLLSRTIGEIVGCQPFLKFENLQYTASFKERGALNCLLGLDGAQRARGVIAVSAGNHAQGVAYHATRLGVPSVIVMPRFTPFVKIENTRRLGAEVVLEGETFSQARDAMVAIAGARGLTVVHPYDDARVIAGQGTIALEMLERVPDLDCLVVPIGGGGLLAGIAVAARALAPSIEIVGVQAEQYRAAWRALRDAPGPARTPQPEPATPEDGPTIAEGIAVEHPGRLTLEVLAALVDRVELVSEAHIEQAIVMLLEIEKSVVEGAGAAGLAAVIAQPQRYAGKRVGTVLCGGNIEPLLLAEIIQRNLVRARRLVRLRIGARDAPGSLARIATVLADQGANIEEVVHQRTFADLPARFVRIDVAISTRGAEHLARVVDALHAEGFSAEVASAS